jgi:hypothetical protein
MLTLAGCHTFETEDGGTFTAFGMPWGLMGHPPSSWLTENLGEVIIGCTAALAGGHAVMARNRGKAPGSFPRALVTRSRVAASNPPNRRAKP